MNKPNVLYLDELHTIGKATELYKAISSEVIEYIANNEYPCMEDVRNNTYLLDALEDIIHGGSNDETLYMITYSAMNYPSIFVLGCDDEPVWEL